MRGWNIVWGLVGGYQAIAGTINLLNGYGIGFLGMATGGGLTALVINREKKVKREIELGIEAFKKQRLKKFLNQFLIREKLRKNPLTRIKHNSYLTLRNYLMQEF